MQEWGQELESHAGSFYSLVMMHLDGVGLGLGGAGMPWTSGGGQHPVLV